jgi:hypothetical protein
MCPDADDIGRIGTSGGTKNKLKSVFVIKIKTGELGRGVLERSRNSSKSFAVFVYIERAKLGRCEGKLRPF